MKIQNKKSVTVYGGVGELTISTRYDQSIEVTVKYEDRGDSQEASMVLGSIKDVQEIINALQKFMRSE